MLHVTSLLLFVLCVQVGKSKCSSCSITPKNGSTPSEGDVCLFTPTNDSTLGTEVFIMNATVDVINLLENGTTLSENRTILPEDESNFKTNETEYLLNNNIL